MFHEGGLNIPRRCEIFHGGVKYSKEGVKYSKVVLKYSTEVLKHSTRV